MLRVKSLVQLGTAIGVVLLMLAAHSMQPEDAVSWRYAKTVAWSAAQNVSSALAETAATNAALEGFSSLFSAADALSASPSASSAAVPPASRQR